MAFICERLHRIRRAAALALLAAVLATGGLGLSAGAAGAEGSRPSRQISEEQAAKAALKALPGKVTDISIEKKRGKSVYVVEVVSEKDGAEVDVLVDPETGQVVGLDK